MRAEELLRRYLEQRREMGERELVLDGLDVEAVMRLIGAKSEADAPRADGAGDWRTALADAGLVIGGGERELFAGELGAASTLEAVAALAGACKGCALHATAKNVVPGDGGPGARFMCIGEAPGANEDETGHPFVGQAGQLLTKILEAIDLKREDVFIANVLKHRPPGNRTPAPLEVKACLPFLARQVEIIRPAVILALGLSAAQALLATTEALGRLRGKEHRYHGIPVIVTYHPAALLRNPAWKRPTWEDVQLARRILDRTTAA